MKILLLVGMLSSVAGAVEPSPCSGTAKALALAEYRKETGQVPTAGAPLASLTLLSARGTHFSYLVAVEDSNQDGASWVVEYEVVVQKVKDACAKVSLKKIGLR